MSWEKLLKANKKKHGVDESDDKITPNPSKYSAAPSPSTQGLHVTKFYMFLKRWLSDTHTDRFLEYYIPYPELDENERRQVEWALQYLLGLRGTTRTNFPGIEVKELSRDNIELVFDDQKHLKERDKHIYESIECKKKNTSSWQRWWVKEPPFDSAIQRAWNELTRVVKVSKNFRRRFGDDFW